MTDDEFEAFEAALVDECPKCEHKIMTLWSGVKCSNPQCDWWFCA